MRSDEQVRQIAYAVPDVRAFATAHSRTFGSGPFLLREDMEFSGLLHGEEATFRMDVAFGQWGDVQVEVMHQLSAGPGIVEALSPDVGVTRLHHVCCIVADAEARVDQFASAGCEVVWRGVLPDGGHTYMIDTREELGHFTELYEYGSTIRALYEGVAAAAIGFDGTDPVRPFASAIGPTA